MCDEPKVRLNGNNFLFKLLPLNARRDSTYIYLGEAV